MADVSTPSADDRTSAAAAVSVSELARVKGVTKQSIAKRLARLEVQGLIRTWRSGKAKMVNLAEWDAVTREQSDLSRLMGAATAKATAGGNDGHTLDQPTSRDPSYTRELTRKAGYDADLKRLELDRLRSELLPIGDVTRAMERCAAAMVRDLDLLSACADDIAAAMTKSGVAGVRDVLKRVSRQLRTTLATSMTALAEQDEGQAVADPQHQSNDKENRHASA